MNHGPPPEKTIFKKPSLIRVKLWKMENPSHAQIKNIKANKKH